MILKYLRVSFLKSIHFSKTTEAYNLWAQCWATAYLPLIAERQKWIEEGLNPKKDDIVYFMMEEKVKAVWKVGKVESVKLGRDGKVREVVVAYKIFKDNNF